MSMDSLRLASGSEVIKASEDFSDDFVMLTGNQNISGAKTFNSGINFGVTTNTDNAYSLNVGIFALADGVFVSFKANAASTDASTLNVNSLGAKKILKGSDNSTQITNELVQHGIYQAIYSTGLDSGSGAWAVMNL